MKNIFILLLIWPLFILSCKKYLNQAPQAEITEAEVFGTFSRYQGFVEDMYQAIPDFSRSQYNVMNWNFSNDVYSSLPQSMNTFFGKGDYWKWTSRPYSFFNGTTTPRVNNQGAESSSTNQRSGFWINGWRSIRVANIAIQNIDMMQGTQEEKNIILGQAYFFRAFFHFNILACWGGIPYVDKVLAPEDKLDWPRLSYLETAKKIAGDLEKAAELLPKSWNETATGQSLGIGASAGRVTKGAAYAYLGKNWLYAASPLMNGMETGNYTSYNTELAKKAADAFNQLLKLAGEGYYGLHTWDNYYQNFWTMTAGENLIGKEWVWGHPYYTGSRNAYGEHLLTVLGGTNAGYCPPTLELVNKFGMANGLPIDASGSGYNPNKPWDNRDPRFYYSLVLDGEKIIHFTTNFPADTYAQFYTNGKHRINAATGFGQKKFLGKGANNKDQKWGANYVFMVPYMRLAHAYLMYAEAANEGYGGPDGKSPGGTISAKEAVNFVRARAGIPAEDARFLTSKEVFRNAIRNEIGVETCLEGHQWFDYRRWYIAHLPENRTKTGLNYDQAHTYFTPVKMGEILFDPAKHYWLPFTRDEASLYPEFPQNPGW
jgi:hypothetical protein